LEAESKIVETNEQSRAPEGSMSDQPQVPPVMSTKESVISLE